ncbi:pickpocket protein 28 [Leptinotarsa decemlineata]|uniref:pickpocket protein 28 n=1 Tax=Leptinotarsa decemlineata TaxID=7539 RepID=UPI003D3078BA
MNGTFAEDLDSNTKNGIEMKEMEKRKDILKPRRKYPGFRKNFKYYLQEFTDYTGIHGFKYMGEQDRSVFERLWWIILFCISLYVCIDQIFKTWMKWDASPVLVSFARSPTPVWQIPFPAITICSETKSRQRKYNFTEAYKQFVMGNNMTDDELKKFSDSSLICDNHLYTRGEKYTELETIKYLMSIGPQFEDVFFTCKWTSMNESCYNMFYPMLTEDGMCFTFNMLDRSELFRKKVFMEGEYMQHGRESEGWTLENGYPKDAPMETFPRRALSAGSSAGLNLVLMAWLPDLDYVCKGPVQGFKILLHHPAEIPRVGTQYFRASLNQEVVVSVKPDMMTTSPGLRDYEAHRRQCFFPTERYLAFYRSYTQQNCQVECLTNITLARCGCVAYHMPHENTTRICGSGSQECMFEAKQELLIREVEYGISNYESERSSSSPDCDCLPACTSLTYNAEYSQGHYEWEKLFQAFRVNFSEFPGVQMTRLTIFFKEQQFITSERNELYGQTDFLANCGGILGLFTGFSVLSIIEIIYFLSLRLMCNVNRHGRRYWSGSAKLLKDAKVND